jgi:hypothetical protein
MIAISFPQHGHMLPQNPTRNVQEAAERGRSEVKDASKSTRDHKTHTSHNPLHAANVALSLCAQNLTQSAVKKKKWNQQDDSKGKDEISVVDIPTMYSSSNPCPPLKWTTCENRNQEQKKMVQCMKPKENPEKLFFPSCPCARKIFG